MEIVFYPNSVLTVTARVVEVEHGVQIGEKLLQACQETTWGVCVGMAAPQIGLSCRVFVALGEVYINPWIKWRSKTKKPSYEGCYSIGPNLDYKIRRASSVRLSWQDASGERKEQRFYGKEAIVIQHEYDHIEGLLINRGQIARAGEGLHVA